MSSVDATPTAALGAVGNLPSMHQLILLMMHHHVCSLFPAHPGLPAGSLVVASNTQRVMTLSKAVSLTQLIYFSAILSSMFLDTSLKKIMVFYLKVHANYRGELLISLQVGEGY